MLPLEGITVIAVEQAVAAPFCSTRLADAGATVIKVERPEGDFARDYDANIKGQSSYFVWLNRGKKSVCIDRPVELFRLAQSRQEISLHRSRKARRPHSARRIDRQG
jgi:crotonobetainyl-CoA:carnitine CoA-transferase CaiB-like acyl-CoA transferase